MYAERLKESLPRTLDAIGSAAREAGRRPEEVRLVAVTKGHPMEAIHAALDAGLSDLGENRVEELQEKSALVDPSRVRWHMIGSVQSRKARALVGLAHLVHSVDRSSLALKLSRLAEEAGTRVPVLLQVNTSGEEAKGGFPHDSAESEILSLAEAPGLRIEGFMTMAPFVDDEGILRETFRRLRELSERLRGQSDRIGGELSMGMSNDLRYAVAEGSTMVRIGTALFGARPAPVVR